MNLRPWDEFENLGVSLPKATILDQLEEIRDGWIFLDNTKVNRSIERMDKSHQKLWTAAETNHNGLKIDKKDRTR